MCPLYVAGLIEPGDRKSIQPMAKRLGLPGYDRLHHFVTAKAWDSEPLKAELLRQADGMIGGDDAFLVIDDTTLPKKGDRSVGVGPQYAASLGKNANCQTLVTLTLARNEVPIPIGVQLFLPQSWTEDAARLDRAGVPQEHRAFCTKPAFALREIDRAIDVGVRFGCVLADAGYGVSAPFRQGLSERGLIWTVGVPRHLKVYPADVAMLLPPAGSRRKRPAPDQPSLAAEACLAKANWRRIGWRNGTKGPLSAHFAARRTRVADGPARTIAGRPAQHLPGEAAWLIGERRSNGETKFYLSNLPANTDLTTLAVTIKARWVCEQAHQQVKEELELDHFEGRSWTGLHRHALMTMIAFAYLQHRRLGLAKPKKKDGRPAATEPAGSAASSRGIAVGCGTTMVLPLLQVPTPAPSTC